MKRYIFTTVLLSQIMFAQSIPVEKIIPNFDQNQVEWAIPIPQKQNIKINWQQRNSSFSTEGIRTFAGYVDNQFVGVISVHKKQLSGSISWRGKNYQITTRKGKILIKEDGIKDQCGTHSHGNDTHVRAPKTQISSKKITQGLGVKIDPNKIDDIPEIYSDGILRVYRLAILVDYSMFKNTANSDISRVRQFWAETELFLNELYTRDLSIRFQVVNNDKLIRKSIAEQIFQISQSPYSITDQATKKINEIIGENTYDIGIVASWGQQGLNGIGGLYSVYNNHSKADAWVSVLRPATVAHELGHLFGSQHTFSEGGAETMNTEPGRGQSIMSYSRTLPRDFFSLPSISTIRKAIQNNADYYTDETRTHRVGPQNSENIVYGIPMQNHPPIIDRGKLKSEYVLPQGSYFQFNIPATDPDGHSLLYTAHQANILRRQLGGLAIVHSAKPQVSPLVPFYPQYYINERQNADLIQYSAPRFPVSTDERIFWLGVSDAGALTQNPNHAVRYDMFQTKVKYVNGTAFQILNPNKTSYNAGEKVTLRWGADTNIFGKDSKVKISMSDDFGQSWKYVLVPETANDGSEEITIPHIELGRKQHTSNISSGLGLIKIEVIGHIAVAISNHHPVNGGFEIKKTAISFRNLPKQYISVKVNQIPEKANITAISTCATAQNPLLVKFSQSETNGLITRIWTTSDTCGNSATFTQYIEVKKEVSPLRFVGKLPQYQYIECPNQTPPAPEDLQVEGGTNPTLSFTQTRVDGDYENYTLKRTWIATDPDTEPISHTQIVVINDGVKPILSEYPKSITIKSIDDMPQNPTITATDNCDGNVPVDMSGYSEIINGKQVFIYSWVARDKSGNTTRHEQRITIDPNHTTPTTPPLAWVQSSLPQSKEVTCSADTQTINTLQTTGGQGTVKITHIDIRKNETCANKYTLERTYTATAGNESIEHTQIIVVNDTVAPTFNEPLPENITIEEGQDIPVQIDLTAKDNCGAAGVEKATPQEIFESGKLKQKIYTWIAKDICGNEKTYTQTINIQEKKIETPTSLTGPKLYPNPANDSFSLSIKDVKSVKIYDTVGRLVKAFKPQNQYDISDLMAEMYVVVVKTSNGTENMKLIKK